MKNGRPRKEIDFKILEKLCELHCTREEIAEFFDIDADTLNARIKEADYEGGFSAYYKKHSLRGNISLRRAQWRAVENEKVPMLIWLGKQILGQREQVDVPEVKVVTLTPEQIADEKDYLHWKNHVKGKQTSEESSN